MALAAQCLAEESGWDKTATIGNAGGWQARLSTTEGSRQGFSWQREGLVRFNALSQVVKQQREAEKWEPGDESEVDLELMAWCRSEAGATHLPSSLGNNGVAEQDEVEAMGERDTFEIWNLQLASSVLA